MRPPRLDHPAWACLLQALAFWPAWAWLARRWSDPAEGLWALAALLTLAVWIWKGARSPCAGPHPSPARQRLSWALMWGALAFYVLTRGWLPPLLQAALALLSVGGALSRWRPLRPASWGLLALALPLLPSLDFYLGFPLRLQTGWLTQTLLRLGGLEITLEGTALRWGSQLVVVDAPCSGLHMLWAVLYLTLALACFAPARRSLPLMLASAVGLVIAGNALRAAALFFPQAGLMTMPPGGHAGAGVLVFLLMAGVQIRLMLPPPPEAVPCE